jgi:hypothetical protein
VARLIGATKTNQGLKVKCRLDHGKYATGRKISAEEKRSVRLQPMGFHGEWNYIIGTGRAANE